MKYLLPLGLAATIASSALSQGSLFPTKRLIGWADPVSTNLVSVLDLQEIPGCKPAKTYCKYRNNNPLKSSPWRYYAGGTAYDARNRSVWVSDGLILAENMVRGCKPRCRPIKALRLDKKAYVSGLAISQRKPRLFQLATYEYYFEVVTYDLQKCPRPISKCQYKFPTFGGLIRPVATGLAYDEVHDMLFISISYRTASSSAWSHMGFAAKASSPCKPICKFRLMPASRKLVTGLAWDNCERALYATDGQITQPHFFSKKDFCRPKYGRPCKKQTSPVWHGLCLVPGSRTLRKGKPCTKAPCNSCPSMYASTYGGDPVFGNNNFGFSLTQAPSNSLGILLVRFGPLTSGIPFLCDRLYATTGPVLYIGSVPMGGAGSCGGNGSVPFPLPSSPSIAHAICGKPISSQWVVFCKSPIGAGLGGLSNAVQFTLSN
ncbi:MAG: hypothetical protein CSA62_01475 [Planctomycetota bacterium]|nr:MAG: hypothetical protein CSA62_01475 [Planctomycetota bacterium]